MMLTTDGYILGLDPPTTRNVGWAIFKYTNSNRTAQYINSGDFDIDGYQEDKRLINLRGFLVEMHRMYSPILLYCIERAIGRGFDVTREKLGENTGVIKLTAYENNAMPLVINTMRMFKNLKIDGLHEESSVDKKILTCMRIKEMFPNKLNDKKISRGGKFTHEADAIGFIVSHCLDYNINIIE